MRAKASSPPPESGSVSHSKAGGGWIIQHAYSSAQQTSMFGVRPLEVHFMGKAFMLGNTAALGSEAVSCSFSLSEKAERIPGQTTQPSLVSTGGVYLHRQDWHPHGEQHGVQGVLHRGPRLRAARHLQWAGPPWCFRHRHDWLFPGRQWEGRWLAALPAGVFPSGAITATLSEGPSSQDSLVPSLVLGSREKTHIF